MNTVLWKTVSKQSRKMPNMRRTRSLSPMRDQSLFTMRLRQRHCIWRSFSDCPGIDILHDPEERDDKRELIKAGHYVLLMRATLLSQPENEKVYSLGDYVAVCSETTDWIMYVMSEINDPSNEVKVRFMKKSGQYILLSKKLEMWFPKSAIFHR